MTQTYNVRQSAVRAFIQSPVTVETVIPAIQTDNDRSDALTLQPGQWLDVQDWGGPDKWTKVKINSVAILTAQRDALLAACKLALDSFGGLQPEIYAPASRREFDTLTAAIALCEKGQR